MYSFDDEFTFNHAKPASEIVMPHFLRVVQEELLKESSSPSDRDRQQVVIELCKQTHRSLENAGLPCIAMCLLHSGWMTNFVYRSVLAVEMNLAEDRKREGRSLEN